MLITEARGAGRTLLCPPIHCLPVTTSGAMATMCGQGSKFPAHSAADRGLPLAYARVGESEGRRL